MKRLFLALCMVLALVPLFAQGTGLDAVAAGLTKEYTIVQGDTLKGIAAKAWGDYSLWPVIWFANRDALPNPEKIEIGTAIKVGEKPAALEGGAGKLVLSGAYAQAYEAYANLGTDQRRWVILEAARIEAESGIRVVMSAEDAAWYAEKTGTQVAVIPPAPPAEPVKITVLHTNDMHAQGLESATVIGYSRIAGYANALRAKGENVLLLDAGDTLHGLPWANLEKGLPVVKLMNAVGYTAMAPGNHDFNYGQDQLVELAYSMDFPLLAANVYKNGERLFPGYAIINVKDVRVAIVGLATPETLYKSDPAGLTGIIFESPVTEAQIVRDELAGKYDVLIGIVHLGIDGSSEVKSTDIAAAVPEFDLIIDGHSHSTLAAEIANNMTGALIVSTGSAGVGLGKVEINVDSDRSVTFSGVKTLNLKDNAAELVSDPAVKAVADGIAAAQAPMLAEVVAQTAVKLEGTREIVRASESNLGRLIANGMLATTGADIALMNGGGIRTSIAAGPITKKDVYTVLPFGNYLWTAQVTGAELKAVLENGVSKLPAVDGRYPHLAGASFTFDVTQPVGSRVTSITVGGVPVDPAASYTLATLNFLFAGGDGYTMLGGRAYKEYPIDADSFMSYVKALGTVTEENIPYVKK